ncbi:site-specific integrase [Erysipelotrichaceae bacterium AF15-26LB]|mgnify:CR=1 FL=1|nr:site-specific integrase [[Clostridium] innocuum]RJV87133.1 site-specific integrase [Erysipelotrichaceae bacterium AF15-26LB]
MAVKKDDKTGKWMYYGSYLGYDSKRVQYKKRGFSTKREAQRAELDFRDKINDIPAYITFKEVTEELLKYSRKELKESSYNDLMDVFSKINANIGDTLLKHMDSIFLQNYIDSLDQKYSKAYVEKLYYRINKVLNFAIDRQYITLNPLRTVKRDARKNDMKQEMLFWEPKDFESFIRYVDSPLYKTMFSFLYYMGCRKGEMMALTWNDIDLDKQTVNINKTVAVRLNNKITPPKTSNSIRIITMPKKLVNLMAEWKNEQKKYYDFCDNWYVFGSTKCISAETLRRNFNDYIIKANKDLASDAKIPSIRIHDLRHSHASYLINNMSAGFTDFDIAKRLGDTVSTLHSTYAHWFKSADQGIIDFMDKDIADA